MNTTMMKDVLDKLSVLENSLMKDMAEKPLSELAEYQNNLIDLGRWMDGLQTIFYAIMRYRFEEDGKKQRQDKSKPEGILRWIEGDFEIVSDQRASVSWDQAKLSQIVNEIEAAGDNPREYVRVEYKMMEAKYRQLPSSIRTHFEIARTVKHSKPTFTILHQES